MSRRNGGPPATTLITGGAGFIGSNLAHRLASEGGRVIVYDDLSRNGAERNLRWLTDAHPDLVDVEVAGVTERLRLRRVVEHADAVFHCAGQVAVTTSVQDPEQDFVVNVQGTMNLLEAIRRRSDPPHLVFTSTNKVYGGLEDIALSEAESCYRPRSSKHRTGVSETQPLSFLSPYGCSKGAADQYVLDYGRTFGIPATVFRMSCIYGPHQHGTEDQGWVAHFVLRARKGEPITVFGDGKQVRDILHVSDLVEAFVCALHHKDRTAGCAFNIGGGPENAISLVELLDILGQLDGAPPEVEFDDWRPGDQRWYVSDTRAFRQATGWAPKIGKGEGIVSLHERMAERVSRPVPRSAAVPVP